MIRRWLMAPSMLYIRIIFRSDGNYMVALASQGRNLELISPWECHHLRCQGKSKRMQSIKSLPSRTSHSGQATRWDGPGILATGLRALEEVTAAAAGDQGKVAFSYFQLPADLCLRCLVPAPTPVVSSSMPCLCFSSYPQRLGLDYGTCLINILFD